MPHYGGGCPHCHNQQVQKVSAVYQQGVTTSTALGTSHQAGYFHQGDSFSAHTVNVTRTTTHQGLASLLSPPRQPQKSISVLGFCGVFSGFIGAIFLLSALANNPETLEPLKLFIIGIGGVILCCILIAEHKKKTFAYEQKFTHDIARWHHAMMLWDQVFYCSRCDCVYHPGTQQAVPSAALQSLLFPG